MTPRTLAALGFVAAGALGTGALLTGADTETRTARSPEAVAALGDAEPADGTAVAYVADEWTKDGWVQKTIVCKAQGADVDCGEGFDPEAQKIHPETGSAPVAATGTTAGLAEKRLDCACGPTKPDSKNPCRVTSEARDARPGEHLEAGTFSGGCVPKVCWESGLSRARPGATVPPECGGPAAMASSAQ